MKILICCISSKFIHTMPSGWFLAEYLRSKNVLIEEMYRNVNEPYEKVLLELTSRDIDKLLFSVYIFNVEFIKKLIQDIRRLKPLCKIIIGGPEANEQIDADHIIMGEGERALYKLLSEGGERLIKEDLIQNLDDIPSPYTKERLEQSQNKLIYYESSRGCPFHCSYCMASLSNGVRYFSLARVEQDLINIVQSGAKTIKFTDRTFNADTERTNAILNFILNTFYDKKVCFHFEVGGDLFEQSTFDILRKMPIGLIQIEAGVQTLNKSTLKAINRVFDEDVFISNISHILSLRNIHMHLDLIAGLPHDTMETFIASFNKTISLAPHMLQLGFLKFLKGTAIRNNYNAKFEEDIAPYEIISSLDMDKSALDTLRRIDFVVDKLYNSGKFSYTLGYISQFYQTPYKMYKAISDYFMDNGIEKGVYQNKLYEALFHFMKENERVQELLRFDFLLTNNSRKIPAFLKRQYSKEFRMQVLSLPSHRNVLFSEFTFLPNNEETGNYWVQFDYTYKNPITSQYAYNLLSSSIK